MPKIQHTDMSTLSLAEIQQRKAEIEYVLDNLKDDNTHPDLKFPRDKITDAPDIFSLFDSDKFVTSDHFNGGVFFAIQKLIAAYKNNKVYKVENKKVSLTRIKETANQTSSQLFQTVEMKKPVNYVLEKIRIFPLFSWSYGGSSVNANFKARVQENLDSIEVSIDIDSEPILSDESFLKFDFEIEVLWRVVP